MTWLINSKLTATVYSEVLKGDDSLAKYFTSWYDGVPMLDINERYGTSLAIQLADILCFLFWDAISDFSTSHTDHEKVAQSD